MICLVILWVFCSGLLVMQLIRFMFRVFLVLICWVVSIRFRVWFVLIRWGRCWVFVKLGSSFSVILGSFMWVCGEVMWILQYSVSFSLLLSVQLFMVVIIGIGRLLSCVIVFWFSSDMLCLVNGFFSFVSLLILVFVMNVLLFVLVMIRVFILGLLVIRLVVIVSLLRVVLFRVLSVLGWFMVSIVMGLCWLMVMFLNFILLRCRLLLL